MPRKRLGKRSKKVQVIDVATPVPFVSPEQFKRLNYAYVNGTAIIVEESLCFACKRRLVKGRTGRVVAWAEGVFHEECAPKEEA